MKSTFRKIVSLLLVTYIAYLAVPYMWPYLYDQATLDALSWNGYGGSIDIYGPLPYILMAIMLTSLIGLLFFKIWARNLFLLCTIISFGAAPFSGVIVQGPIESIPAGIISLCMGAILSMSYLSSVKSEFQASS